MSISTVSSTAGAYQTSPQAASNPETKALQALASSLQSGNLSGAQQAYAALQKALPGGGGATPAAPAQAGTQNSAVSTDFQNLGAALQSGNLGQAQQAFQALQNDAQAAGKTGKARHHHHHGGGGAGSVTAPTTATTSATASTSASASDSLDSTPEPTGTTGNLLNAQA